MNPIETLTTFFKQFPGIGPRQAKRFVYFLLQQSPQYIDELIREIERLRRQTAQCPECFIFFTKDNFSTLCDTCTRENTDTSTLLLVAKDVDVDAIKKAGIYTGRFFVLGGTLPFLEKAPEHAIRIVELQRYITKNKTAVKEIIFALPVTPEGDHTRAYILEVFRDSLIRFSTLGRGLSTGTEIEYTDTDTIASAFKNRF